MGTAIGFGLYVIRVADYRHIYPEQRAGQAYFNTLDHERPDLSARIRATDLDPFHNDDKIPAFLAFVAEAW